MKDLRVSKRIFKIKIIRDKSSEQSYLSHSVFTGMVLYRFNMNKATPMAIPLTGLFVLSINLCLMSNEEIRHVLWA